MKGPPVAKPNESYSRSEECFTKARHHDKKSEGHDVLYRHLLAQNKEGRAGLHKDAGEIHMTASAHFRKAGEAHSDRRPAHADDHHARGAAKADEAEAYEAKHKLELDKE